MAKKGKSAQIGKVKLALIFAGLFILFAEVFVYTWCKVQVVNTKYAIADLRREAQKMQFAQDNLKIELARLRSPERIAVYARENRGLVMPTVGQFATLPQTGNRD